MKVKELLKKPENWTQGANARDAVGYEVASNSLKAVCWCLVGAITKCYPPTTFEHEEIRTKVLTDLGTFDGITNYNDHFNRKHSEILALVTRLDI